MLYRYSIGIFKCGLTQQRFVLCVEPQRSQVWKRMSPEILWWILWKISGAIKKQKKNSVLRERLIASLMTCLAHKKNISFIASDPLCFEASTEARRIQNTNGPLNWPSNWALWKSNGCHHTEGQIQNNSLFPHVHKCNKYTSDAPFWSSNSPSGWIINETFTGGTWKEGWYGCKQPNLPCRLAFLVHWCCCGFSITATVYMTVHTSCLICSWATQTVLLKTCTKIKQHLGSPQRDEDQATGTDLLSMESISSTSVKRKAFYFIINRTWPSLSENNL